MSSIDLVRRTYPNQIIPIHDGYSKPFFLKLRYDNYERTFEGIRMRFHRLTEPRDSATM